MRVDVWLKNCTKKLKQAGISNAELDCLVLLEDILKKDRSWLLAHLETKITDDKLNKLNDWVEQRAEHMPLAYIRGKTEFYGREFLINHDVLEPRPESETMIELLKQLGYRLEVTGYSPLQIADIGTGSGALAITAKLEMPEAEVWATDIDPKCLAVARKNAQKHQVKINFLQGNLLEPIYPLVTIPYILLCNLPYVPNSYRLNSAAMNEPKIAIFGGPDGLDLYRQLFEQVDSLPHKPTYIFTESLPPQHKKLASLAKNHGYNLIKTADFIQIFKN